MEAEKQTPSPDGEWQGHTTQEHVGWEMWFHASLENTFYLKVKQNTCEVTMACSPPVCSLAEKGYLPERHEVMSKNTYSGARLPGVKFSLWHLLSEASWAIYLTSLGLWILFWGNIVLYPSDEEFVRLKELL